jgi:hypothetical protein
MPKYKVLVSGWENHFRTFGLDKSDINTIKDILDKNQTDDISRPNYNLENIWFEVKDSLNNRVLEFAGTEMTHQEEVYGEDEDLSESFDIQVDDEFENVMLVVDEYKGGLFELQIHSDTIPVPSDFSFMSGSVVMPDFDLDFISKIFFKGEICIPQFTLDNDHKGTSIYMVNGDIL